MSNPGGSLSDLSAFAKNASSLDDIISLDISDVGIKNLDMDLLGNQNKVSPSPKSGGGGVTASPYSSSGATFQINNPPPISNSAPLSSGIEFVNVEDTQRTVSFNSGGSGMDTIHINKNNHLDSINLDSIPAFGSSESNAPTMLFTDDNKPATVSLPKLSPEQEITEKNALLTKMRRLASKGVVGNTMNMTNSLDEIKAEYSRLVDSAGLEKSIKFQRNLLVTCVTGMEFLNQKFNPIDVNLDGWSESVNENQEDFDEIFEELYDKYKDKTKVAPEIRLLMTLGISASMCHLTNTFFKSKMPGMGDILRENPDLARQFASAAATQSVGPGFANFMSMGMPQGKPVVQPEPFSGNNNNWASEESNRVPTPVQTARREMKGPSGVEDILRAFEQEDRQSEGRAPGFTPPSRPMAEFDDNQSIYTSTTINGSEAARKSGRGGKRKPTGPAVGNSIDLVV